VKIDWTLITIAVVMLLVGGVAGHFFWPGYAPATPTIVVRPDSVTVDSLRWIVTGLSSRLVVAQHDVKDLRTQAADAREALGFWQQVAARLKDSLASGDSVPPALALRGDTVLVRTDTAVVRAGASTWAFITPRTLRAAVELDLVTRRFNFDVALLPSTLYYGVYDTVRVVEVRTPAKLPLWWEAVPFVGGGLCVVGGYEKATLPVFIGAGLLVVDVIARIW